MSISHIPTLASIFLTLILLLIISCKGTDKQNTFYNKDDNNKQTKIIHKPSAVKSVSNIDSSILLEDTATILGGSYKAFYKTDEIFYVINAKGDTILKAPDLPGNFTFNDFNGDGYKDIRIRYVMYDSEDLFLFDKVSKTFKLVEDFSKFPELNPIKGTKYYYSYHKSGCADLDWDSDLFYIENFRVICIGNISGRQCNDRDEKDGIYINKIKGKRKILFQTLSIKTIEKYNDFKWGFIKKYWSKNYLKFVDNRSMANKVFKSSHL